MPPFLALIATVQVCHRSEEAFAMSVCSRLQAIHVRPLSKVDSLLLVNVDPDASSIFNSQETSEDALNDKEQLKVTSSPSLVQLFVVNFGSESENNHAKGFLGESMSR